MATVTTTPTWSTGSDRTVPSAALLDALDRQVGYDARTRQGLSNHLPMELVALDGLGAPADRLEEMLERWTGHMLDERRDTTVFDAYRAEIGADGIDATVVEHLPRLVEAPSSEWFHSMIRLAYALDAGHQGQVASALTDWTNYERLLPGDPPEGGDVAVLDGLRHLTDVELEHGSHADLAAVARQDAFRDAVAGLRVDDTMDDVAHAAAAVHVAGADIGTLHLVTGTQAARTVSRLTNAAVRHRLARRMVQAVAAGYVASGAPALPDDRTLEGLRAARLPEWEEVRAAAVASPDVHVTKLVYTCRIEVAATGDPLYAWLAAREVGLVS